MLAYKLCFLFVTLSLQCLSGAGKKHKHASFHKKANVRNFIQDKDNKRFHFHSTQNVDDLVKNPTALNSDEAGEINKLDNLNDVFMNSEVTSETQDLSRQGLDPYVAMQISKLDHNFQDIFGPRRANQASATAKQKGEIVPGYGEQYNSDGSVSLSNSEWPEYQMKDTPPMLSMSKQDPNNMLLGKQDPNNMLLGKQDPNNMMLGKQNPGNMMLGNGDNSPQISPQAALNPNLLPGQKSDLGMGMGVGMGKNPFAPMTSRFVDDGNNENSMNKKLMNAPFGKPGIKNAGFRIPGEFSFKGERKSAQAEEDAKFVKNFMSSKKSHTEKRKISKKGNH